MRILVVGLILTVVGLADEPNTRTVITPVPDGARFQLLQSEVTAKGTFKLDHFTGRVWQLMAKEDGSREWSLMYVQGLSEKPIVGSTTPRFQIFTSGLAYKFTFLLDTLTGRCWQVVGDDSSNPVWQFIPDSTT